MPEVQQKEKGRQKKSPAFTGRIKDMIRKFSHAVLSLGKDLDNLLKMGTNYWTDMQRERKQLR